MARGRLISKTLSTSERWARLHTINRRLAEFAQSFYPLLIAHSDDFGRLPGDVFTVKHVVNPTSPRKDRDFDQALYDLAEVDLIRRYRVGEKIYIEIVSFDDHQSGLHKRTASKFPEAPKDSGKFREFPPELKRTEQKGTEGKRNQIKIVDQNPRENALRSRPWKELRTLVSVRKHLRRACHELIESGEPQYQHDDPHQLFNLSDALKNLAARQFQVVDYDGRSIDKIVQAVLGVRARREGRAA